MRAFLFKFPWLAAVLGLVFLIAGVSKLGNPALTFAGIQQYDLLEANLAYIFAEWLPWFEIALGILLWVPRLRFWALGIAFILQFLFLAAAVQAILRGLEITCVCFGTPFGRNASLLIQEVFLLALTGLAGYREWHLRRK